MPNYSQGKIYKLTNTTTGEVYIGSTTKTLNTRLNGHKSKRNTCSSKKLFESGGDVIIELLENYPCDSKKRLETRERHYISDYAQRISLDKCVNQIGRMTRSERMTKKNMADLENAKRKVAELEAAGCPKGCLIKYYRETVAFLTEYLKDYDEYY